MLARGDKREGSINGSYSFGVCSGGVGEGRLLTDH